MMKLELVIFINKYIVQLYLIFDYLIRALRTIIHLSTKWQYWFCNTPWHRALRALGLSSCMMATLLLVPAVSVLIYSQLVVFRRRVLATLYADLKAPDKCKRVIACLACVLGPYTTISDRTCYQWVHCTLCTLHLTIYKEVAVFLSSQIKHCTFTSYGTPVRCNLADLFG